MSGLCLCKLLQLNGERKQFVFCLFFTTTEQRFKFEMVLAFLIQSRTLLSSPHKCIQTSLAHTHKTEDNKVQMTAGTLPSHSHRQQAHSLPTATDNRHTPFPQPHSLPTQPHSLLTATDNRHTPFPEHSDTPSPQPHSLLTATLPPHSHTPSPQPHSLPHSHTPFPQPQTTGTLPSYRTQPHSLPTATLPSHSHTPFPQPHSLPTATLPSHSHRR